jgi:hypothetical protein
VSNPGRVATIGEAVGEPGADAAGALGLAQQQQAAVRGLVAALEINCELLAMNGWQVEREGPSPISQVSCIDQV